MANVKDLLVNGSARVIGTIYGNATSATDSDKLDGKHLNEIASAKSTTLAWNTSSTIATIGGNNITVTMPANPNTDTHYTTGITAGVTGTTSNSASTNGNTFIKIKDNSTHRGQIKLVGSGATSVASDANGVITISSTDNNTTYGSMSVSEGTTGTATSNRVLTAANLKGIINAHAPTKTGSGASGTWGISISGNAATATKLQTARTISLTGSVTGSGTFDGSGNLSIATTTNHTHSYLPLSGGTITGDISFKTANYTSTPLYVRDDGTSWGHTLIIGADGTSYIGAGEAPTSLYNNLGVTGAEHLYLCADRAIYFYTNCDPIEDKKLVLSLNYNGTITLPGNKTIDTSGNFSGNAATASKVNNKLTVGSKTFDGSAAVTIAASDLGLASAMLFLGTTTTAITDGAKTNPVVIGGSNKTVTAGNVVLYGSKEFVWTGSAWEELGNEGSYKIVQAAVADPSASGTSNTFIATISQDSNGKITATKKTVAVTNNAPTLAWGTTSTIGTVAGTNLQVTMPANPNTDTKNTAGSSNTSSKIFLVGATSQTSNAITYSHNTTYVNDDEVLVSSAFTAGTNHIIAPKGGQYSTETSTVTGYLKITLPVSWNNTMMRFYVDIYNYQTNTMVTYMIGGYNYISSSWINVSAIAYGRKGSKLSNLKVHFGHDGSKCAIYIGSADTTWTYPQVMVRDILVGFGRSALGLDSGWSIGFTTTLGTITATVDNPYIGYNAYTADNVAWSGITSKPSYYDAKAIKSITRSGTTFTATHLDGTTSTFTQQDNNTVYSHPAGSAASKSSGLYKFSTDSTSHISGVTAVTKADITALGIPGSDTNTWRPVVDNLTSTATDSSLSANQGKVLKGLIDGKASASHTHNYAGSSSAGGIATSSYSLTNKGTLDTQDKINNFLTANKIEYATFKTSDSNNVGMASNDGMILSIPWTSTSYGAQIAFDDATNGIVKVRGKSNNWGDWYTLLHSGNYNSYTVTKTGSGASGTWGINVSGNASSATKLQTARTISLTGSVTGSGTFDGSGNLSITTTTNHTHNYAGSSSVGGAANSANKLATARTITLSGAVTGSASFDGSKNITINTSNSQQTLPYSSSTSQLFVTSKANQASYTLSNFVDNAVYHVYVNGFKIPSSEYTVSSSGVVTLANPPELANQEVEVVANYTSYVTTDSSINNSSYLNYYRQATAPSNTNALWLDTSTTTSSSSFTPKLYDGGKWTAIGGGTTCTDAQIDAIFA